MHPIQHSINADRQELGAVIARSILSHLLTTWFPDRPGYLFQLIGKPQSPRRAAPLAAPRIGTVVPVARHFASSAPAGGILPSQPSTPRPPRTRTFAQRRTENYAAGGACVSPCGIPRNRISRDESRKFPVKGLGRRVLARVTIRVPWR